MNRYEITEIIQEMKWRLDDGVINALSEELRNIASSKQEIINRLKLKFGTSQPRDMMRVVSFLKTDKAKGQNSHTGCNKCKNGWIKVYDNTRKMHYYKHIESIPVAMVACACRDDKITIREYLHHLNGLFMEDQETYELSIIVLWDFVNYTLDRKIKFESFNPFHFWNVQGEYFYPFLTYRHLVTEVTPEIRISPRYNATQILKKIGG